VQGRGRRARAVKGNPAGRDAFGTEKGHFSEKKAKKGKLTDGRERKHFRDVHKGRRKSN